jgi:hypothetical protein
MNLDWFTARVGREYLFQGFMEDIERLAAGATPEPRPTFLERARAKWQNGWQP